MPTPSATQPGSSPAAVVIGELLIDVVRAQGQPPVEHVGGSPANVAMGLARLGHDTHLATLVGADDRGERCVQHVEGAGVHLLPGSISPAEPTSTAIATLDASGAATYEFDLHWDLPPVQLPARTRHVHTGSIATTLEPGADNVEAALRRGREVGTTSYDPNIRPTIMGDADGVRPRVEALVALADVVKCSDDDLAWLYPGIGVEQVMADWCAQGASLCVVTLGSSGVAWRVASGEADQASSRARTVVDTVGAGDSFMAGLISGLLDAGLLGDVDARGRLAGAGLSEVAPALDRALATSAITVAHAGAYAPTRRDLS